MGVLRPVRMLKIGIVGLKEDREALLTALQDLGVAQVETVSADTLRYLDPERGTELQRTVGDEALRFRGLKSALPPGPVATPRMYDDLEATIAAAQRVDIDAEVGALHREADQLLTERRSIQETLGVLARLTFYPDRLEYLDPKSYLVFLGESDPETYAALRRTLPTEARAQFVEAPVPGRFLLLAPRELADLVGRIAATKGVELSAVPQLSGTVAEERERLTERAAAVERRRAEIQARLAEISQRWYAEVVALEEAFAIQNRLCEVYTRLGAGQATFAIEGWVPERELRRLQAAADLASQGRAHLYRVPSDEEPPTLMDNPPGIRRFEFFIRFYSLPKADEWDPTLVFAIVFPIFFGFMLSDWGYGLVILGISIWMIRGFPGAQHLPKAPRKFVKTIMGPKGMQQLAYALIPGCLVAIALGLVLDEFFGATVFLWWFHYVAPIQSGVNVGILLLVAGYIGLAMVTLGFLFGALKEYFHHHPRGVAGKLGGIVFAWGVALLGLSIIHGTDSLSQLPFLVDIALAIAGALTMALAEGMFGAIGVMEIVSHVLSYTRLVGILLASVILAGVINYFAHDFAYKTGTYAPIFIVLAFAILILGQAFNIVLAVFEPGIQGARLIFVEYFSKFYSGNGKPFRPFGSARTHTRAPGPASPATAVGTSPALPQSTPIFSGPEARA